MADWKCDQFDSKRKRQCRRNATVATPWGDACDKCAAAKASSVLTELKWYGEVEWAVKEIVRQVLNERGARRG